MLLEAGMRMKRCPGERCPKLIPQGHRYCGEHMFEYEERRGRTGRRGYGWRHQQARVREAERIAKQVVSCARCKQIILPDEAWDLGHSDDRATYVGAEHVHCNRAAGGRNGAMVSRL